MKKFKGMLAWMLALCLMVGLAPGAWAAEVIGEVKVVLDNYANGTRLVGSRETNTGDFAADALYYRYRSNADAAIVDAGSIANGAVTGRITDETCRQIHPDGDNSCMAMVTGQQILDALEWGARFVGEADCDGLLQVSGLRYTVDDSVPCTVRQENGVWTGGPTGPYRVRNVTILDKNSGKYVALDRNKTYTLAGYDDIMIDLEQGFAMFEEISQIPVDAVRDDRILSGYIQAFNDATVGSGVTGPLKAGYDHLYGEGRITILGVFDDVNEHWSGTWVYAMYNAGLVLGVSNNSFEPERKITRAEFAAMLYRCCGLADSGAENPFGDVYESDWYYDEVVTLYANGIVNGYGDGTFAPNAEISRQEMVQMVYNVTAKFGLGDADVEEGVYLSFADAATVDGWAVEAVNWAVASGVLNGYNNMIHPLDNTTRAEATTLLCNWLVSVGG